MHFGLKSKPAPKFRGPQPSQNLCSHFHIVAQNQLPKDYHGLKNDHLSEKKSKYEIFVRASIMFQVHPYK